MMAPTTATISGKHERALLIIRSRGGIEHLSCHPGDEDTRSALELLVLNEKPDRAPYAEDEGGSDVDSAFLRRVCSKLICDLRYLPDVDWDEPKKEEYFLRTIHKRCRQTERERDGRYDHHAPHAAGLMGEVADERPPAPRSARRAQPTWWHLLRDAVLSRQSRLAPLLALYEEHPDRCEALLDKQGRFNLAEVAEAFGWTRRECRTLLTQLRREIGKVRPMVPRSFRDLCNRLNKLAATSFEGLADVEFRRELFDLSRSLATSFEPDNVDARAVRKLSKEDFDVAVDLLIDEWQFSDQPQQRTTLDRLRESIMHVRDALQSGSVEQAFAASPRLVLDAACVQHHLSPSRLQVLLAYSYFLRVGGLYDAYIRANEAILRRCEAVLSKKGADVLDQEPEFESGETLRRVRSYAATNILVCRFNYQYTTAPSERFQVKDYDGLASLLDEYQRVQQDDPKADFILEEQLVLRAHLARAAYNLHRSARNAQQRERWLAERDRRRSELREFVHCHYLGSDDARACARRLIEGTLNAAEGCAADRTLDVIEELLHDQPAVLGELRAERLALVLPEMSS